MKVLETSFNNCVFRSRLEARWAVFMHELNVPYLYEPEAYDLDDGIYYLPDFWLPQQDYFLEIKPSSPTAQEERKAVRLARFTGKKVLICFQPLGIPDFESDSMILILPAEGDNDLWRYGDTQYFWCQCPHCKRIDIQFNGRADRIKCSCPKSLHGDKGYNYESLDLRHAYNTAQKCRFWDKSRREFPD